MKKKKISETKLGKYFHEIIKIIKTPEMGLLPGQLAFYMLLSLVPLVTLACYSAKIFELDYTKIVQTLDVLVPGGIGTFLPTLSETGLSIPMILIIIWMLYIASNGCNTIIIISNNIYGIRQSTWFKRRIKAIFMTIMIVVLVIALLLVSIYLMRTGNMIQDIANLSNMEKVKSYLQFPVMFIVLFLFLRVFYNFAPDRMRANTNITVGTLFSSIGITLLTLLYSYIARNMANYELLYGGLANVALLMAWLYFVSFVFVIGLALNYGEEKEQTKE